MLGMISAPNSFISTIESIRRRFFWGFKENEKKIVWVRWQNIIADKKYGGLGVGSIKAKNLSLLGKWRWRFLNEKDALLWKVISKIYDSDGGFDVRMGSGQKSSIWGSIIGSCSELNQIDISLSNLIVKKISSGRQTLFWNDIWLKDIGPLKFHFPRLYALDLNKKNILLPRHGLKYMIYGNGIGSGEDNRLGELSSLNFLITMLVLDSAIEDKWTWALEDLGKFFVRSFCKAIHSNFFFSEANTCPF
ncbi:hypothetical protein Tco_0986773 [Tanacetum coccineum]